MEQAGRTTATPVQAYIERQKKMIWKPLEAVIARGYQPYDVFRDWLDLMTYALQRRDPEYLRIIRRYPNDREQGHREADYFAQAFGSLMSALQTGFQDYLGLIYEEQISSGHLSQIFTPESMSQAIIELTTGDQAEPFTVCDPACGSGQLLIEAVKRGPVKYACGIDLDDRCAKMCALNLLFLNANAIVVCGNTLTDTLYTAYEITRTPRGGMIREAPGALCREGVQRYLNHALAIPPMFWEAVRDKRYFWQGDTGQTPADRAEAKPESANETPRKAVPLSEIFTPLARIQQGAVIKELAEVGIKRRRWQKSLQQSIGDYDIGHVDAYTVRIRPWFTSAHDFQSYAIRLGGAGYEVTPDSAEEGSILVRKHDRSGSTGLDFG